MLAGDGDQPLHARLADAALGLVDDALEGEVVVLRVDQAQVGVGVPDLRPLEEARAADHRVGNLEQHEPLLEAAHLERRAHQHRRIPVLAAGLLPALDLVTDHAGLGLAVPHAGNPDLVAALGLGPQRLAEPALVGGDQARSGLQDVRGGAVVALQPHHLGAGEIALEAQDVVHLGAPPAVDRLVVIADAADVAPALGQQAQPQVLGDIGVLVLVHQQVAEALLEGLQHVRMGGEDGQIVQQQVAKVAGVQRPQPVLVLLVQHHALAVGEGLALGRRGLLRGQALVLPAVDQAGEVARRPALQVEVGRLNQLLQHPLLVVVVQDGEAGLQPHQLGVAAQDLRRHRVEGAEPAQPFSLAADQVADALAHFAGGLVGEGDDQQLPRPRTVGVQDMGQARGQHPRLAGPGACEHQHRALRRLHRSTLLGVQAGEIVGGGRVDPGEVGDARRGRGGGHERFLVTRTNVARPGPGLRGAQT